ncbi:MAG: hypothetical protein H8D34_28830 [Chloroflexi bacterium]|nr:hypothetical protein [Chloroflexota bacterium]
MPWYSYKSGGWQIAVDAINQRDAAQHIKIIAPGAKYMGEFTPPRMTSGAISMATATATERREAEIRAHYAQINLL